MKMELSELEEIILRTMNGERGEVDGILDSADPDDTYPFNAFEFFICKLISANRITFREYEKIRSEYIRSTPNLKAFRMGPRWFGEKFAQGLVLEKCPEIKPASKEFDPEFSGEYDLWLDGIKVEVKASRAVNRNSSMPLHMKALSKNTEKEFWMNYQQLKPQHCNVFIFLAVFLDEIAFWILNRDEVWDHQLYSPGQHRGNMGNEGQLHVRDGTIDLMDKFKSDGKNLGQDIRDAAARRGRRNNSPPTSAN